MRVLNHTDMLMVSECLVGVSRRLAQIKGSDLRRFIRENNFFQAYRSGKGTEFCELMI